MIEVNIVGQLGNQLFEYACARKLQALYGETIVLNIYEMKKNTPNFNLGLLDFNLNENVKVVSDKPLSACDSNSVYVKFLRRYTPNLFFEIMSRKGIFIWKSARKYKELPQLNDEISKNIVLNGYWQSEKYFSDIANIIKQEFKPNKMLLEKNVNLYHAIQNSNSVCVTIRRGDFMNDKNKDTFYVCDENYFSEALAEMKRIIPDCTFFGFSDDIEWVKENVKFPGEVYFETGDDPIWEKLRLMSSCKHFILSNSSFSWWAQYLSDESNKVVIAPDIWYKKGKNKHADIYQEGWKLIHIG